MYVENDKMVQIQIIVFLDSIGKTIIASIITYINTYLGLLQ